MPAVPEMPASVKALCVAPFGMEEGTSQAIENRKFVLVVGEPAQFDFLGSTLRHEDQPGEVVEAWEGEIELATTLETELSGDSGHTGIPGHRDRNPRNLVCLSVRRTSMAPGI